MLASKRCSGGERKLNEGLIAIVSFHYIKGLLVKHHLEDDMQPLIQDE